MDYYGPRVPLGGGALSGKHPTHIDRIGARAARDAALHAVQTGAGECLVQVTYAPNSDLPLDVNYRMEGRGELLGREFFGHSGMLGRYRGERFDPGVARGSHFLQPSMTVPIHGSSERRALGAEAPALLHSLHE